MLKAETKKKKEVSNVRERQDKKQINSVIHARFNNLIENMLSTTYTVFAIYWKETLKKYIWNNQLEFQKLYNDPSPYITYCSKCPAFIFHQEQLKTKKQKKTKNPPKLEFLFPSLEAFVGLRSSETGTTCLHGVCVLAK